MKLLYYLGITIPLTVIIFIEVLAQDQHKIDSLTNLLSTSKNDISNVAVLLSIGDYYESELPDTALHYYTKALNLSKIIDSKSEIAQCLNNIGNIHFNKGSYLEALELYLESKQIYEDLGDKESVSYSLNNIGAIYQYQGNFELSLEYYQKSLSIKKELGNKEGIAATYSNIGVIYYSQSKFEEAKQCFLNALEINIELDIKPDIADSYNTVGLIYYAQSDYENALEYFQKSLKIHTEINNKLGIANAQSTIGIIYNAQGNYDEALKYYQKSLTIYESLKHKQRIGGTYNNIGIIHKQQQNYILALEYFENALEILEEVGDLKECASLYHNVGGIYYEQGELDIALEYYQKSIKIEEQLGNKLSLADSYIAVGNLKKKQRKNNSAIEYFQKALDIKKELNNKAGIAEALVNIASLNLSLQKYEKAIEQAEEALLIILEIGALEMEKSAYSVLSDSYKGLNNFKKAFEYKNLWISINDSIYNVEKTIAIAEIQSKYETEKKQQQIELQQAQLLINKEQIAKEKAEKEQNITQRNMLILGFIFMIILSGFIYWNYNSKKKINAKIASQNDFLEQKNRKIELLMDELNHRVMNNIQIISSILTTGSYAVDDEDAKKVLEDIKHRMSSIMIVHRLLLEEDTEQVNLRTYIYKLVEMLSASFSNTDEPVELALDKIYWPSKEIVPLGIVLNELITNAYKHGKHEGDLKISITMKKIENEQIQIVLSNNKNGVNEFSSNKYSFGLKMVEMLLKQINGCIEMYERQGSVVEITFPQPALSEA